MSECLDRAMVEPLRYPARIAETNRHLVHDLLAFVRERGRQTGQHRLDLFGGQSDILASPLMRVGRVGRMPFAVDDDDDDLALEERVAAGGNRPRAEPRPLLAWGYAPRSCSARRPATG